MGKKTGFLEYEREENRAREVFRRIGDFKEFRTELAEDERREQGARCMNCGVPFCQSALMLKGMTVGCPLHNLIPEWNDEVYRGHPGHALSRLLKTNNFPEFTGRVCPALCEKACINGLDGEPVTVHDNELYIIEHAFRSGKMKPRVPKIRSGKKVAVVGSGPAGLAAADQLNRRGHSVTVYEREEEIGGLLMYGIPNMKIDKKVLERRRRLMEAEGVRFVTGVNVGAPGSSGAVPAGHGGPRDGGETASEKQAPADGNKENPAVSAEELLRGYDAVALCTGAKEARKLSAAGMENVKSGIYYAVDYLTRATKELLKTGENAEGVSEPENTARAAAAGKHVVILGGGDTGNDCAGTAVRFGAASLLQIEMMPALPDARREDNPWPEWPKVRKTDYGVEEAMLVYGGDPRIYKTTVKEVLADEAGALRAVKTVQVAFRKGKLTEVEGTEQEYPCELLLVAAGFTGCERYTADAFGVPLDSRGRVKTDAGSYATKIPGVFTAGDMHRGQSLVVWAIHEGRGCARDIDRFLMGYTEMAE